MAVNLIESAKSLFNSNLIGRAGALLGEGETGIRKAIEALVPTILAALFSKGQASHGAGLSDLLNEAGSLSAQHDISGLLDQSAGTGEESWRYKNAALMDRLFDGKTRETVGLISAYSGLKASSAESLLGAATPAVLSLTADEARAENKSGDHGLWAYLISLKDQIWNSFPAGFSLAGLLGAGSVAAASGPAYTANSSAPRKKGGGGWLWILLLALLALVLWYLLGQKGCGKDHPDTTPADTTMMAPADTGMATVPAAGARESMKVQLPDGTELNAFKGGIEDRLVAFLKTDYKALGTDSLKKIWFDFDNLNFGTGNADITPESQVQINNLAAILKAFPQARLKIGGYTDKTGNEPGNVKLSGARATAVKKALDAAGVGAQIDGAEGYGSQFAQFPADAPETDRVKDRHVSVSVRG
ncbi:OmpA family protein [Taibaiella helva]|uniref:OmpA family protein n=1 Tax=Taibaiella helva TaxID=2301235 RepID=UPI000E57E614|nr:OmpA family protein [Taibaiella helva]